jgi:hypothetical protein
MMQAASTSETSVNFYQTTRRYNPEDSYLHTHRRENVKSKLKKNDTFAQVVDILVLIIFLPANKDIKL